MKLQAMNKATLGALTAALVGVVQHHLDLGWDAGLQAAVTAAVVAIVVWAVPNSTEKS